jgi:adenylosuccinate lyase
MAAMDMDTAICALDGRYRSIAEPLAEHLSERALNRHRLAVEAQWLAFLSQSRAIGSLRALTAAEREALDRVVAGFDAEQAAVLRRIEAETGHDVKAVEYYLKQQLSGTSLADVAEFVHFGCTSEDINNLSYGRMLRAAVHEVWLPAAIALREEMLAFAVRHRAQPMLSHTHGQPATPTTVGKEIAVFVHRLGRQLGQVQAQQYLGKFNGATGTYSAHVAGSPTVDWIGLSRAFVESQGLVWNPLTTQIEAHDYMAELFSAVSRFNAILNNFNTDVWHYIGLGYFRQMPGDGSVGSSTMPHKINPIRFENSEANLELSNALLHCLSEGLATSRMQRDLSDSSLQRNIGAALGHSLVGIANTRTGLRRLDVAPDVLERDLDSAWEVLGEAVQTVMRRTGYDRPYERLKDLTRGNAVSAEALRAFIRAQSLPPEDEQMLLKLEPRGYTGLAERLVSFAQPWATNDDRPA